jgi:mannan endo-1,6-alpha-mannosidase
MKEYACESNGEKDDTSPNGLSRAVKCNPDQRTFKAYFARWLAKNVMLAPFTASQILPWLQGSATAAVQRCTGTAPGIVCGRRWYREDNEEPDIGHQMTVMSVVQSNLIQHAPELADLKTGTSTGNAAGGSVEKPSTAEEVLATRSIATGEKVGGWIMTMVLFVIIAGGAVFLVASDNEIGLFSSWSPSRNGFR